MASNQSGPVALPLQSLHQIPDVVDQILPVFLRADSIHAVGGLLANVAPAFQQKILVDQPIEVEKPVSFFSFAFFAIPSSEVGIACSSPSSPDNVSFASYVFLSAPFPL